MFIANRLVFFLAILITYYTCEKYPSTIQQKGPLVIKRAAYVSALISVSYIISGFLFEFMMTRGWHYGTQVVTDLVTAALCSLLIISLSFLAPGRTIFLTGELKKMMVFVQLILALSTFTLIDPNFLIKEVVIYSGMYFFFVIAFAGVKDRMSIAPIPAFIKGLPLDLVTLFLFLLSFSFLNGVFFDQLF